MPLVFTTPISAPPVVAPTSARAVGMSINFGEMVADICYDTGTFEGNPPVFASCGERVNIHLDTAKLTALLGAHPNLYADLKAAVYESIAGSIGKTGNII